MMKHTEIRSSLRRWVWMVVVALSAAPLVEAQSLWTAREGAETGWIADHVATRVGDIITVLVEEQQDVSDDGRVELSKDVGLDSAIESFDISPNTFSTLPAFKYSHQRTMDGESRYEQRGTFRTTLSAVVVDVQPNGNLLIEGFRNIHLDGESKQIRVRGYVRPVDISSDNTIVSSRVAHAEVLYDTDGERSRSTSKGWWEKVIDIIWFF